MPLAVHGKYYEAQIAMLDRYYTVPRCQTLLLQKGEVFYETNNLMSASSSNPKGYPSPPLSRSSHDSNEELQALEYSEGPIQATRFGRGGRSFSISGFDFQHALLPLAASMSDPEAVTDVASEKSIGLVNGKPLL